MTMIESAWPYNPGYKIELIPVGRVRVWDGETLLAESTTAVRLEETGHLTQIYLPLEDLRRELFVDSDYHTPCPFKGRASYMSLADGRGDERRANLLWYYPDPMKEVAGIEGLAAFYPDRVRIEIEERRAGGGPDEYVSVRFLGEDDENAKRLMIDSNWGDAVDLLKLIDVQPAGANRFVQEAYRKTARNVVEGSQILAQTIVAAAKAVPDQIVISANIVFARPAMFDAALEFECEILRKGRSFATVRVLVQQDGKHIASAQLMLGVESADLVKGHVPMPDLPKPNQCVSFDFGMSGRSVAFVANSYDRDPKNVGPSEVNSWVRFRKAPPEHYLHQALLAQFSGHTTIAGALRPFKGLGEDQAHVTLSTGVLAISITLHDRIDVTQWMLYCNPATHIGGGLAHGEGRVFSADGRLLASYSVEAMVRPFKTDPSKLGTASTVM